jgi:hypothetical protein
MSDDQIHKLTDKNIIPTEELIFSLIGSNAVFWHRIMKSAADNYNGISGGWNYYNDGKQWLFKLVQKKKTLFWASLLNDTFRVTFWFGDKAEPFIEEAMLPPAIKDEFRNARKYGAVRPVSITLREQSDADNVITLMSIKHRV